VSPERTISSTFWAMMIVQTIGSADIFTAGPRKLPAPKQYVAIGVLWSVFHLLAAGPLGRLAASLSVLVVLTGAVLGPFGPAAVAFLAHIASRFSLAPASPDGGASSLSAPPSGPTQGALV
jgi:hypothetical protein